MQVCLGEAFGNTIVQGTYGASLNHVLKGTLYYNEIENPVDGASHRVVAIKEYGVLLTNMVDSTLKTLKARCPVIAKPESSPGYVGNRRTEARREYIE